VGSTFAGDRRLGVPTGEEPDSCGLFNREVMMHRRLRMVVLFMEVPEVVNELDESVEAFALFDPAVG
jgi:hypothetical protein